MIYAIYIGETESSLVGVTSAPTSLKITLSDVDAQSTGRASDGIMVRTVVRGGGNAIRKLEMGWSNLNASDAQSILSAIGHDFFWLKYYDPYTNDWRTAEFNAGDRSVEYRRMSQEDGTPFIASLSFSAIER